MREKLTNLDSRNDSALFKKSARNDNKKNHVTTVFYIDQNKTWYFPLKLDYSQKPQTECSLLPDLI